jgi:hypothetical protein
MITWFLREKKIIRSLDTPSNRKLIAPVCCMPQRKITKSLDTSERKIKVVLTKDPQCNNKRHWPCRVGGTRGLISSHAFHIHFATLSYVPCYGLVAWKLGVGLHKSWSHMGDKLELSPYELSVSEAGDNKGVDTHSESWCHYHAAAYTQLWFYFEMPIMSMQIFVCTILDVQQWKKLNI